LEKLLTDEASIDAPAAPVAEENKEG